MAQIPALFLPITPRSVNEKKTSLKVPNEQAHPVKAGKTATLFRKGNKNGNKKTKASS